MSDALPPEFALIAKYFRPLAGPGALDLSDDAALLTPPPGRDLVLTADAMVGGVHFLPDDPPDLVGRKLLRVNLSDLAAKGATPLGYLMTVSTPRDTPEAWFAGFAAGLAQDQAEFGVTLLGGDTTSTPGPISLSLTIIGHVAPGMAVHRFGAQDGDGIWVTGTIGDGALGLAVATGGSPTRAASCSAAIGCPSRALGLAIGGVAERRHGCLRRPGPGPGPHLPRQRRWRAVIEAAAGAAVAAGARRRGRLAGDLPDRRRRLRAAAGGAAGARGGAAGGGRARAAWLSRGSAASIPDRPRSWCGRRPENPLL